MRLLLGLAALTIAGLAFWAWRTIARSPKLDNLFNFSRREADAKEIFERQREAEQALTTRKRTLGKRQGTIERELDTINKKAQ